MTLLAISVPGVPVPQGSMKNLGRGRVVHSNAEALLPWRAAVIAYLRAEMAKGGEWPVTGPVKVGVTFYLVRPKSAPKGRMWPDKKPDLDKLARAIGDALEQAGVLHSDAQIVQWGLTKVFGTPGMALTVRPMAVAAVA